jgi:hypothetical protein
VIECRDSGIDMEMRMGVNESRDESEEEEEVSTFEDMNYILDTFEYDVDMAGNFEEMDSGSGRYSDDLRMLVLEGDEDDVLANGMKDLKYCEMLSHVGLDNLDIDMSGHLDLEVLPVAGYVLIRAGVVMGVDKCT